MAHLTPMVGRGPELAAVIDAFATSRAVVVVGEAGVGKTRLVSEAVAAVEEKGDIAVTGRCLPLSAGLPLLPIIDLLRNLAEVESGRLWKAVFAGLPPSTKWEIQALMPEVEATSNVEEPARVSGPALQARLFDALRQVLKVAGEHGVDVVVEDVHWADQTTRDLLEYLLGSAASPPTSMVLTCRTEESASPGASDWLLHLPRLPGLTFVHVGPLDPTEAAAHLRGLAGDDIGRLDVHDLVRRSEGNAFFLEQLARSILQGEVRDSRGLPRGLRSVLVARIDHVEGLARDVLSCLAVLGDGAGEELLAECTGSSITAVRDALHVLRLRHLVRADTETGGLRVAHALLAEAVVGHLLPGEQRDWHLRVASALEADVGTAGAGAIAEHYRLADRPGEELRWRVLAAEHADELWAPRESSAHWQRAIELSEGDEDRTLPNGWTGPSMYRAAARATVYSGHVEQAAALSERALEIFGADADVRTRAALLAAVGTYRGVSDPRAAVPFLRHAVSLYETIEPDDEYLDAAYFLASGLLASPQQRAEAASINSRALVAAGSMGGGDQLLGLTMQRAWLTMSDGDGDGALAAVTAARDLVGPNPHPHRRGTYTSWSIDIFMRLGRPEKVLALLGVEELRSWPDFGPNEPPMPSGIRAAVCQVLIDTGDVEAATRVIERGTRNPPTRDTWPAHACRAWVDMLNGDAAASQERWASLPHTLFPDYVCDLEPARVELDLWLRRPAAALASAMSNLDAVAAEGDARLAGRLVITAARAYADLCEQHADVSSDADEHRVSDQAGLIHARYDGMSEDPLATGPLRPTAAADALAWKAEWSRAAGTSDPGLWEAVADAYAQYPRPHQAGYARWREAQGLLVITGKTDELASVLRQAAREAHGHEPLLGEIRRLASQARVSLDSLRVDPGPASAAPFGLTPRELEVLLRVSQGDTNRQIGKDLFISEKTASVHVSNIMRKLQVANRWQAVAKAERVGILARGDGGSGGGGSVTRKVSSTG